MELAVGTSAVINAGLERPSPTYDFAEFPSLAMWTKFDEMTGTSVGDQVGNFVAPDSMLTIVANGVGNAWATNGRLTTNNDAANNVYVRTALGDAAPAAVRAIGSSPIIFELDIDITGGDHTASIVEIGNSSNGTIQGIKIGWNGTSSYPQILVRGASASAGPYNFTALNDLHTSGRTHLLFVWNRSANDTVGVWNVYRNGILHDITAGVTDYVMGTDPGVVNIAATGGLFFGTTATLNNTDLNCGYYNGRIWMPSSVPANIATIAADLARYPDRLPDSAKSL